MTELIKGKKYYCSDHLYIAEKYRQDKEKRFLYEFDGERLYCKDTNSHAHPNYWEYKVPAECSEEIQQANARLIDDLLEACIKANKYLADCASLGKMPNDIDYWCEIQQLLSSAIAKAKGEEKSNHV